MTATRITLIDDHAEFRELLTDLLTEFGYEVSALTGDRTTIEAIAETDPKLLILDLLLGGGPDQMSGWEYLKLVRSHASLRFVPVLVCSGDLHALRRQRVELANDEALAVLPKPFTLDQAEQMIAALLSAHRLPEWDDERDLVLVADAAAWLVDASAAALRTLGLSLEDLRRHRVSDIVAQSVEWTESEWRRYRTARHWEGPVTLRRRDGVAIGAVAMAEVLDAAGTEWHISRLTLSPTHPA